MPDTPRWHDDAQHFLQAHRLQGELYMLAMPPSACATLVFNWQGASITKFNDICDATYPHSARNQLEASANAYARSRLVLALGDPTVQQIALDGEAVCRELPLGMDQIDLPGTVGDMLNRREGHIVVVLHLSRRSRSSNRPRRTS